MAQPKKKQKKKTLTQSSENWRSSRKLTIWLMSSSGSEILLRSPGVRPRGSQITRQISEPQALYHLLRWRQCVWKALADRSVSSTSRSGAGWESAFTRLCPAPSLISPYLNSPNQSFHSHMLGTTVRINRTLAKGAGVVWWTDTWGVPSPTQLPSPGSWHPYVPITVSSLVLCGPVLLGRQGSPKASRRLHFDSRALVSASCQFWVTLGFTLSSFTSKDE